MRRSRNLTAVVAFGLGLTCFASFAFAAPNSPPAPIKKAPAAKSGAAVTASTATKAKAVMTPPSALPPVILDSDAPAQMADWIQSTGDNRGLPYIIIDKVGAKVYVYAKDGALLGSTPALIGSARGDDSTPGVGDRELSDIAPADRTTPAGRFMAAYGPSATGEKVFWVDYETAISLHPVVTAKPQERRLERLRTPTVADNRITFGCINVSTAFYEDVVRKTFMTSRGVVYILPETRTLASVFPMFGVQLAAATPAAGAASTKRMIGPPP